MRRVDGWEDGKTSTSLIPACGFLGIKYYTLHIRDTWDCNRPLTLLGKIFSRFAERISESVVETDLSGEGVVHCTVQCSTAEDSKYLSQHNMNFDFIYSVQQFT